MVFKLGSDDSDLPLVGFDGSSAMILWINWMVDLLDTAGFYRTGSTAVGLWGW